MDLDLGNWALIDIETTGVSPVEDEIIDVGYLQFEGTKLVKKFSSLVRPSFTPSRFIQKLTGINEKMLKKAPTWNDVSIDVVELYGHSIVAHNAEFEKSFLADSFEEVYDGGDRESYQDSLPFLALLFPYKQSLKLENFIVDWELAESETHRGYEDSLDLLKVLLISVLLVKNDTDYFQTLNSLFHKYNLRDYWYYKFLNLFDDQLEEIAESIDFDLEKAFQKAKDFEYKSQQDDIEGGERPFSFQFSGDNIKKIFRSEDVLREEIPQYKYRSGQEELSLRVGQSFKNGVHALVQAPTGTGKTMGYLVPSALFSMEEEKKVLVATGTKTLQHQAMYKDVPQLRKILGLGNDKLKVKRLVGSNNHYCELLFRQTIENEDLLFAARTFEDNFTDMYFELLFYHNAREENFRWILRDDVPFIFRRKFEKYREKDRSVAVDFRSCTGNMCPFKNDCTYIRGLREAKDADIVIGNHALMFSWPRAFPRPEYIVVDEAHKIEEETTRAFSLEASQEALESFSRSLNHMQGIGSLFYLLAQKEEEEGDSTSTINEIREQTQETFQMLQDHLKVLPDAFELYFKKGSRYTEHFWNELPFVGDEGSQDFQTKGLYNHLSSIKFILSNYSQTLLPYASLFEPKNLEGEQEIVAYTRFESFYSALDDLVLAFETLIDKKEGFSHSLKFHEKEGYCLYSGPINVGETLYNHLLQTSRSVFFTSATLGNAIGDQGFRGVEWATGYGYLEPERRFRHGFFLPAPYDYKKNTKVFLCDDVPHLYDVNFVENVLGEVIPLIRDLGGRSLLLFSAKKRFEQAREILLREFDGQIPLFIQGMGSSVVEEFKKNGHGVLLGMESFGEGIDIPGETLSFVFVDKVPDLRMDLVINDRRHFYETNIGNEFTDYYLSHRTRSLQQKLGRLLRTESDRGGVIIVDSRTKKWKGKTIEKFNKLMEPYVIRRTSIKDSINKVRDFILDEPQDSL